MFDFYFSFHWPFWLHLVTNSDSQISEHFAQQVNPCFTMFSSMINVRDLILKGFLFAYLLDVTITVIMLVFGPLHCTRRRKSGNFGVCSIITLCVRP